MSFRLGTFGVLSLAVIGTVFAAPPATPYNLGETLSPTCAPGSANCTVVAPAASGANNDITSLASLTSITTTGTTELTVTNNGTGKSFVVNDAPGDTTPFVIDADGNVGIGNPSPTNALTVRSGNTPIRGERTTSLDQSARSGVDSMHITDQDALDGFGAGIGFYIQDNGMVAPNEIAYISGRRAGADDSGRLDFHTYENGAESVKMRIAPNGYVNVQDRMMVGRLTSIPDADLSVKSDSQNAVVNIYGKTASTDYGAIQVSSEGSLLNASNRPLVLQENAGNVGIGVINPRSALHIPDGKYHQAEDNNAGTPPLADCDNDNERGRISIDTLNNRLYVCNGAARGWDYAALTD